MNIGATRQLWTGFRHLHPFARAISSSSNRILHDKNSSINAFVCTNNTVESSSGDHFPLGNVTIGVKDNICTSMLPTTCSSAMLQGLFLTGLSLCALICLRSGFAPPFDATVVKLLEDAGAVTLGKTNCDEFGMGSVS